MTNPVFYGSMAHALGAYAILLTVAFFSRSWQDMWYTWLILLGLTAIKEFWYDVNFEIPQQPIIWGGIRDFLSYQAGAAIVMIIGFIKFKFLNKTYHRKFSE